eukprot:gene8456-13902_t
MAGACPAWNIFMCSEKDPWHFFSESPRQLAVGSFVATAYSTVLLPLDTVKTRLQASQRPGFAPLRGLLHATRYTIRQEGMRGLFSGWRGRVG